MAILTSIVCKNCGKKAQVCHSANETAPGICGECSKKIIEISEKNYFNTLDKMTLEERIRMIEIWIYTYEHTDHIPFEHRRLG